MPGGHVKLRANLPDDSASTAAESDCNSYYDSRVHMRICISTYLLSCSYHYYSGVTGGRRRAQTQLGSDWIGVGTLKDVWRWRIASVMHIGSRAIRTGQMLFG